MPATPPLIGLILQEKKYNYYWLIEHQMCDIIEEHHRIERPWWESIIFRQPFRLLCFSFHASCLSSPFPLQVAKKNSKKSKCPLWNHHCLKPVLRKTSICKCLKIEGQWGGQKTDINLKQWYFLSSALFESYSMYPTGSRRKNDDKKYKIKK